MLCFKNQFMQELMGMSGSSSGRCVSDWPRLGPLPMLLLILAFRNQYTSDRFSLIYSSFTVCDLNCKYYSLMPVIGVLFSAEHMTLLSRWLIKDTKLCSLSQYWNNGRKLSAHSVPSISRQISLTPAQMRCCGRKEF